MLAPSLIMLLSGICALSPFTVLFFHCKQKRISYAEKLIYSIFQVYTAQYSLHCRRDSVNLENMQNQIRSYIVELCTLPVKLLISFLLLTLVLLFQGCQQGSGIPDFGAIKDVKEKKIRFFGFMRPLIEAENQAILKKRERLLHLYEKHRNKSAESSRELKWLNKLLAEYRVDRTAIAPEHQWKALMRRVDVVPVELALIQAAKESGWGSSRFARKGNNMFGQRCFKKGCGLVPNERVSGEKHEVVKYDSVGASVRSYIRNLNTGSAYRGFRRVRFEQRKAGQSPDGYELVSELPKYSERKEAYIEEIRAMIQANRPLMGS